MMKKVANSFLSIFIGWLVPFASFLAWMQFRNSGDGRITDFEFLLYVPLCFTALGWVVIGIPLSLLIGRGGRTRFRVSVVAWMTVTIISFLFISAVFRSRVIVLIWWPISMGFLAGCVFWVLEKKVRIMPIVAFLIPMLFFPFIRFILLPIGITFFPYSTHILGEGIIGDEPIYRIMQDVKVGDSFEELNRKYPQIFAEPFLNRSSGSKSSWFYFIEFDENRERVIYINVHPPRK